MKINWTLFSIFFLTFFSAFAQEGNEKKSTATSNVSILQKEFIIPELNNISHKIWVYLPPNYKASSKKYPVIYMPDAQNLFDDKTSFVGEWHVDESLNELYKKTKKGFIVVGIENGGEERINEYTPWVHEKYGGGKGAIYIDFIKNTLKPYIDSNYRTKIKSKHTALIGSSLGGLISYYGGLKYPNTFGKIGALSTSFWFSNEVIVFTKKHGKIKNQKMYILAGGKEGYGMDKDAIKFYELLKKTGYPKSNLKIKINPEGKHTEAFWDQEFLPIINWLFTIN
jgi:alpha-glucosidase